MPEQEYSTCEYCRHTEMCHVQYFQAVDEDGKIVEEKGHVCKDCIGETYL